MGLADFIKAARHRVEEGAYALDGERLRPNGSLIAALSAAAPVIAEVKPRSPSQGRLLQGDPADLIQAYVDGGAAALSVLADADHFDGSPALVRQAHAAGLPILWKDFVVDCDQIDCAAHNGASAVLLIERCFQDPGEREAMVTYARNLGLEVLLEVHGADEAAGLEATNAEVIGVNARDLDTLEVDPAAALDVVARLADQHTVVALSGIHTRRDREAAKAAGARGVLVGTSLMTSPRPHLALRALRRPLAKVCGLTRFEDVDVAAAAGADLAGFVVGAPESPRQIAPVAAQALSDQARSKGLSPVLVTPHKDAWEVREWCRVVRPDFVQLHGLRPDAEWIHSLGAIPTAVLHAIGPDDAPPEDGAGLVVDTPSPTGGGSGEVHDWTKTANLLGKERRLTLVAGGLAADNAADAVQATGAWGADASSRLESEPGIKDPERIHDYVKALHDRT